MTEDAETARPRCAFCRQRCPLEPVAKPVADVSATGGGNGESDDDDDERSSDSDGSQAFCSTTCRRAYEDTESVFIDDDSHRKLRPGVAGLDASLPQGLPRNTFLMLVGNSGTREEAIQAELVWRTLERGEPAVVVAFTEPPTSVVANFLAMDWNVLPYLEADQLHLVDCFTYRMDDRARLYDRMTDWNAHLLEATEPQTTAVRDPSDSQAVLNAVDNCLEALEMVETGVVVIDSIAEYGSLVQPVQAYDFVKNVRAEVCKGRFVPVIAGATVEGPADDFPRDLDYVVDGVVDLRLDNSILEDTLFRRVRVRKLRGVLAISEWHTYEYTSGLGMVTFDPQAELEGNATQPEGTDPKAAGDADAEMPPGAAQDGEQSGPVDGDR